MVPGRYHRTDSNITIMKKALITLPLLFGTALLMIGADFRAPKPDPVAEVKKHCVGYTIIEAGLGVDCNGDTVRLVKKYGYYELASRYEKDVELAVN
jgi:hypothetical protein